MSENTDDSVVAATRASIDAAVAAGTLSRTTHAGPIAAMLALAGKIDHWDTIVRWAEDDAAEAEKRPAVPQNDNVSLASYLKYCNDLHLTPASVVPKAKPGPKSEEAPRSKLASVKDLRDGKAV